MRPYLLTPPRSPAPPALPDPAPEVPAAAHPYRGDPVFDLHAGGKLRVSSSVPLRDAADLSLAYTPGVAQVSRAIARDARLSRSYTWVPNTVAVVTDGTAVLGLGDVGPAAAMPVMEGKALLFEQFAGIDAVPLCLDTTDVDEIVHTAALLAPSFGGINLEDIAAPRCFEVERRLQERVDIPVFHDDQHGTAIVVTAALRNALAVTGRSFADARVVLLGAGAAGIAVGRMLRVAGADQVTLVDRHGVLRAERDDLTPVKRQVLAELGECTGASDLAGALAGADVFIGVSGAVVPGELLALMARDAIVFALANPDPEVPPDVAHRYAAVVATGRSDHPNQINNVLAFPGVFRGALDVAASRVSERMKLAAAWAIADLAADGDPDRIVPSAFDPRLVPAVAEAVRVQARAEGLARA